MRKCIICNFKDDTTKVSLNDLEDSDFGDFVKTQKNKSELKCSDYFEFGDPKRLRTADLHRERVTS